MFTLDQRREAREAVARPGKFQGEAPIVPLLWDLCLSGFADEDSGDMFRVGAWLLWETESGFVYGRRMANVDQAVATMQAEYVG